MPQVRAALFDLDDTLIDHQHASRAAMVGVRDGFPAFQYLTLDELGAEHQRILEALHHEVALGRRTVDDARVERYRRLFAYVGAQGTHASAAAELHRRVYHASRCRVPGALELLRALQGRVRIAVVTNNTVAEQTEKLAAFGLEALVDALVTSEEIGAAKPDGRIFAAALRRIDCAPDDAVMIGDSWTHDVLGATKAGMSAIWFNRNGVAHPDPDVAPQIATLLPTVVVAAMIAPIPVRSRGSDSNFAANHRHEIDVGRRNSNLALPTAATATLTASLAAAFAQTALANVVREYPNKPDHVQGGLDDVRSTRSLHPAFYGSFDWHSCVHMHWLLARMRRLFPELPQRDAIGLLFDRHLTPATIGQECAYLERPESHSFERTYGWAWLLEFAHELRRAKAARARRWADVLAPLADAVVARYLAYLPLQRYPLRAGLHANSAFGLLFALDYARAANESALEALCTDTARRWFGNDRNAPAAWEPSGADFLSPALVEADLMRRILTPDAFADWLREFLPELAHGEPAALFTPAVVDDRSDPFIVHLDGLNLSRAWSFRGIAAALPADDPRTERLREAAARHLSAGLTGVASEQYAGEHWLATFATLALTGLDSLAP